MARFTTSRSVWRYSLLVALALVPSVAHAEGLTIALTNDDGWDAPGIQALKDVLRDHGHAVTLVGSSTRQSGSGTAANLSRINVHKHGDREYSAALSNGEGAEPVTCALLAVDIATSLDGRRPDLLVSGINSSANIGSTAMHSGTVGAVVGALNQGLNGPIPGIAISTDEPDCDDDCVREHYRNVAVYLAELIEHLQSKPGFLEAESGFLPEGVGLNVNYPTLARDQIQGVRVTKQGRFFGFVEPYVTSVRCADCVGLAIGETASSNLTRETPPEPEAEDSDAAAFYAGYITIVPIEADFTSRNYARFAEVVTTELSPPD